jgi:hypothetical protein
MCNYFTGYHGTDAELNFGFWGSIEKTQFWHLDMLAPVFILINAILINTLFNRNEFMEKNNYITSMLYVSFMSFFPSFYYLDGLAISQTLTILVLIQLFRLNQNQDGRRQVFNAAILFGLACTLSPIFLIGTPFLFWMVWVLRPFVFRESVLILTGFTVPLIYAGVYSYVFQIRLERDQFSSSPSELYMLDTLVLLGGLGLLLLMSASPVLNKLRVSSIRIKKLFRIIGLLAGLSAGIIVLDFFVFEKLSATGLIVFPLAFLFPFAFGERELRALPTFIFYLILLFSIGKFFIPYSELFWQIWS